jgi:hypothetical protein
MALMASAMSLKLALPNPARVETTIAYSYEQSGGFESVRKATHLRYEKVIAAQEGGYRVSRRTLEFRPTAQAAAPGVVEAIVDALPARDLTYLADPNLMPQSVENWYDLSSRVHSEIAKSAGVDPADGSSIVSLSLWATTSPADAVHYALSGEVLLARAIGAAFQTGKPVVTEDPRAFLFNGEDIASKSVLSLETIDQARGIAVLRYRREADAKALKIILDEVFSDILREHALVEGGPVDAKNFTAPQFEDTTTCRYEVDLATGLPTKAECENTARRTDLEFLRVITYKERWAITQTLKN